MKKLGFTLAEVLIALVIIGVISSLTIPTVMQNTRQAELKAALKKSISVAGQAVVKNYATEGTTPQDFTSADDLVEYLFKKQLNTMETGSAFTTTDCTGGATFTTADGILFCVSSNFSSGSGVASGNVCDSDSEYPCATSTSQPNLWIDVNGGKAPNTKTLTSKAPKDVYQAMIYSQKVVPFGQATQEVLFDAK